MYIQLLIALFLVPCPNSLMAVSLLTPEHDLSSFSLEANRVSSLRRFPSPFFLLHFLDCELFFSHLPSSFLDSQKNISWRTPCIVHCSSIEYYDDIRICTEPWAFGPRFIKLSLSTFSLPFWTSATADIGRASTSSIESIIRFSKAVNIERASILTMDCPIMSW